MPVTTGCSARGVVGTDADSWAGELALGDRARLDVRLLADHVHALPTRAESMPPVAERMAAQVGPVDGGSPSRDRRVQKADALGHEPVADCR